MQFKTYSYQWLIATILAFIISLVALQDIGSHAAWSFSDDMSITYAHIYKYPDRFEDDIYSVKSLGSRNGSIVNWGSALLWGHLDIDPIITYSLFAYLQSLALGLSIYFVTWQVTKHFGLSLFALFVAYALRPYIWNLGNYNDLYPFMYAAQLSLGLVLFGLGFALAKQRLLVLLSLVFAGLVHPMMGAYGFSIVGLYWLLTSIQQRDWKSAGWLLILPFALGITIIPSVIATSQFQGTIPSELFLIALLDNGHLNPFPLVNFIKDSQVIAFFSWFSFAIFTILVISWKNNQALVSLLISAIGAGVILIVSQWVGISYEIPRLIQVSGGRVSYILAMLVIPLCMVLLLHYIRQQNVFAVAVLATSIIIIIYTREFHILSAATIVVMELVLGFATYYDLNQQPRLRTKFRNLIQFFLIVLLLIIFLGMLPNPTYSNILSNLFSINFRHKLFNLIVVWFCVAIMTTALLWGLRHVNSAFNKILLQNPYPIISGTLILISLIASTYSSVEISKEQFMNEAVYEFMQLQDWAIDNTDEDAYFMGVVPGWRSRTVRPYLYFIPRSWYIYTVDERLLEWQIDHLEWLGYETDPPHPTYGIKEHEGYYKLNSQSVLGVRDVEGVDYAIWNKDAHSLNFQIAFETKNYVIYDLHHPISVLISEADLHVKSASVDGLRSEGGFIFDARIDGGFNSLRPNIILDYVPNSRVTPSSIDSYQNEYRITILNDVIAQPDLMNYLRIEYVYIDEVGWEQISKKSQLSLLDPNIYEEIIKISLVERMRAIYRLVDFKDS